MKKQQIILLLSAFSLLALIFFLAPVAQPAKATDEPHVHAGTGHNNHNTPLSIENVLASAKEKLTATQKAYVLRLENTVVRGDIKNQTVQAQRQLAAFWKDSANSWIPYAYYTSESAKLENSEKNLNFAANLFLSNLQVQENPILNSWMAKEAKELFEQALVLNPANDSATIGLGGCYIFGTLGGNPMEGILKVRGIAEKNPDNVYAQYMLGMGGLKSGQFDRAEERFKMVVEKDPKNMDAILRLAEVYERLDKKADAIKLYEKSKALITNPEFVLAVEERIKSLK